MKFRTRLYNLSKNQLLTPRTVLTFKTKWIFPNNYVCEYFELNQRRPSYKKKKKKKYLKQS